ncbi:MAG: Type 1 glutamine amidotransferase-like domain-containing protein [Trebonia sp.]
MLLTSAGLRNDVLTSALADLVGKPFARTRAVFIPTASVAAAGDHGWLVEDLSRLHGLRWREFDILELNGLPKSLVLERLRHADVIYAAGGNHYHLTNSIIANDLAAELADILAAKVYVGVSAGSMIFSKNLSERAGEAFGEQDDLRILGESVARSPFGLFDWYLKPHLNSPDFPNRTPAWFEKAAAKLDFPVYALDDASAVRVRGEEVDVVSDGSWLLLNAPAAETPGPDAPRTRRPDKQWRLPAFLRLAARLSGGAEGGLEGFSGGRHLTVGVIRYVQWQGSAAGVPEERRARGIGLDPVRHVGHKVGVVAPAGVLAGALESPLG